MRLTVHPPYWLDDTLAMICEICAVAVPIERGESTCALPMRKPWDSIVSKSMRQQFVMGAYG